MARPRAISGAIPDKENLLTPEAGDWIAPLPFALVTSHESWTDPITITIAGL
jgi:hypothetical protein